MAVTFGTTSTKPSLPYFVPIDADTFIPEEEIDARLHFREFNIKDQEREFVNSLGLIYHE